MVETRCGYEEHEIPGPGRGPIHSHPYGEVAKAGAGGRVILKFRGNDGEEYIEISELEGFVWVGPNIFHTFEFIGTGGIIDRPINWSGYPHIERDHL